MAVAESGMRRTLLAWVALCVGCASGCQRWSYEQFDRLGRTSQARTIVLEPDFSLYSPYDAVLTRPYVELVREQDRLLGALFQVQPPKPWVVVLIASEDLGVRFDVTGDQLTLGDVRRRTRSGIGGFSSSRTAYVYVAKPSLVERPGQAPLTGVLAPETYTKTVRHELAHLYAALVEIDGPPWLEEGFAHLLESVPVVEGRLHIQDASRSLERARRVPPDLRDLQRTLELREDLHALAAGAPHPFPQGRVLAQAFVHFMLVRLPASDWVAELRRIRATPAAELLTLEPEWRRWIDGPSAGAEREGRDRAAH